LGHLGLSRDTFTLFYFNKAMGWSQLKAAMNCWVPREVGIS
jgi:hypothetical protein